MRFERSCATALLGFLTVVPAHAVGGTPAHSPQDAAAQVIHLSPEEIPNYISWVIFFDRVIRHHDFGRSGFERFLGREVGLAEPEAYKVLEYAFYARAIEARYPLHWGEDLEQRRLRVRAMRELLERLKGDLGEESYQKLRSFVEGPHKSRFSYSMTGEPQDYEILEVYYTFDSIQASGEKAMGERDQ